MELKIEYVPIETIAPYENNAKVHTAEQIEQIKKSIEDYGMNDPIGIWHDTIVEGHGRLMACLELGYTEVPVIRLDHMTDEQRKAYSLIHNKLTMDTGFDLATLQELLFEIGGDEMSDYGFQTSKEIEDAINDFFDGDETDVKSDKVCENVQFKVRVDERKESLLAFLEGEGYVYDITN